MTNAQKDSINLYVPLSLAAVAGYVLYRRGEKSWQMLVALLLGVFVVAWLITRKVTASIVPQSALPDDVGLTQCSAYDPKSLTDRIYNDIYCKWCFRNTAPYVELLALSKCEFVKVHNDWNKRYLSKDGETLRQAINGESGGSGQFFGLVNAINASFDKYGMS